MSHTTNHVNNNMPKHNINNFHTGKLIAHSSIYMEVQSFQLRIRKFLIFIFM